MAASDEFPRGTSQSIGSGASTNGSLVIPACPGISHVLTDIFGSGRIFNGAAAAGAEDFQIQVLDGAVVIQAAIVFFSCPPTSGAGGLTADSNSWSGKIIGSAGNSMTIQYTSSTVNSFEALAINWYDV